MDIKLTHSLLLEYLDTNATPSQIANSLSLSGPTVDHLYQTKSETIYEIEIITNRIDSASAFGVAREAAAILPQFGYTAKLKNDPYNLKTNILKNLPPSPPVKIQILDNSLVSRFTCITIKNISIKSSPPQTQKWLTSTDQRPINNLVDITNELTLRYGQPVHAFDLDKIGDQTMILRSSNKGEKITTLDGHTHTLKGGDIIIEDGHKNLIDLCGIMGAENSQIDQNTKNILLFVQTYEPKHIRKTSLYTQERTLAAQIFEKNPDPELVMPVLLKGVQMIIDRAGGQIASQIIDIYPQPQISSPISFTLNWLNQFAGINITSTQIKKILTTLGIQTIFKNKTFICTPPSWRLHDINIKEDIAEEIIRVYGYFRLPSIIPPTTITKSETAPILKHEHQIKQILVGLGFTEIYNYSLISQGLLNQTNISLKTTIKLQNPLSNEFLFMRPSLIPSILANLQTNRGKVSLPLRIFELSNIYEPKKNHSLPQEIPHLAIATQGLKYLDLKGYLDTIFKKLHLSVTYQPLAKKNAIFSPQTATVHSNQHFLGYVGTPNSTILNNFQLNQVGLIYLNFAQLSQLINPIHQFHPIPETSSIIEDLTITSNLPVDTIYQYIQNSDPNIYNTTYTNSHHHNHTFKIEFNNPSTNLTQQEINIIKDKILSHFKQK